MSKKQAQDVFLGITLALVVVAGALALAGWAEYETSRDNHRGMFITNDYVTNLHHELVKGGVMVTAELFNTDPVSRNGKDGVTAYYHCDLCDTTTKQTRSQFAIPDRIRCVRCAINERGI